ncbi:PTS glucose transporter subunit IIA [Bacillaceae bacterium S4-13-56]
MFFNKFKKNKKNEMYAPVNGEIVQLQDVPDPVFSEKMMGEGIAILPEEGELYSPVEGKVIQVAPTKHAIGILASDGSEILLHVGLETVLLKGSGFTPHVKEGDEVTVGQHIMSFDLPFLKENVSSTIIPMVITNSLDGKKEFFLTKESKAKKGKTVLITIIS